MHFANMEEKRMRAWVSLLCRAATEDGSIWDLLPIYTSLTQPSQDVMTDLETLDGSIASDRSVLAGASLVPHLAAHCLDRLSGCTRQAGGVDGDEFGLAAGLRGHTEQLWCMGRVKLFSMTPQASSQAKFITINSASLLK